MERGITPKHEIETKVLPEIVAPTTIIGSVNEEAAETTGFNEGIPVVAGSTDMIGSFLGSGAWKRNDMLISYGTYGCAPMLRRI